jgi:hypothetical protein
MSAATSKQTRSSSSGPSFFYHNGLRLPNLACDGLEDRFVERIAGADDCFEGAQIRQFASLR